MSRVVTSRGVAVLAAIIAAIAILSTARVFSATVDEPAHLAAGLQWLTTGDYTYDLQHPPLGRIAVAAGPYARGERGQGLPAIYDEGARILGAGNHYVETLASARHGVLVFFLLMMATVWLWARRLAGEAGAAAAAVILAANPVVLAHSGLATTDSACAATTVLALLTAIWWADAPTTYRALLLGLAVATAIGTRMSSIAFLGGSLAAVYGVRLWAERRWAFDGSRVVAQLGVAVTVACVAIAALYRFHIGPFLHGVDDFLVHGGGGHPTFLLGTPSNRGWWYYFPVALLVKTPIPMLLLATVGAGASLKALRDERDWRAAAPIICAAAILGISLFVKVDLGVRLVLPVYPLLAIVSAQGIVELWRHEPRRIARAAVAALIAWSVVIPIRAHPDYLSYFNALAGDHPEHVLVDSNLDWGQDLYRLRDTLRARGVSDTVRIAYFGTTKPAAVIPNSRVLGLHERTGGWIAASETFLAGEWVGPAYMWLLRYPSVARIGPGMRLWHIPADAVTTDSLPR